MRLGPIHTMEQLHDALSDPHTILPRQRLDLHQFALFANTEEFKHLLALIATDKPVITPAVDPPGEDNWPSSEAELIQRNY